MALTHAGVWTALDRLAVRAGLSASGLARAAGLDPTSFNRSKRSGPDSDARPRWPSTESVAKVLAATGVSFAEFAVLAEERGGVFAPSLPVIGLAQAGAAGFFDEAGLPTGEGWERIDFPGAADEVFALEVTGDSMLPLYRPGDRLVVAREEGKLRRGDRIVVKTLDGEVMAKELRRMTIAKLDLASLNPDYPPRTLERKQVDWVARILWASQ